MTTIREKAFTDWLQNLFPKHDFSVEALTGDAGFRRYFRLNFPEISLIAVDAPPDKSNNNAFVEIAKALALQGILVPEVQHYDEQQGFLVIADLGSTLLSDKVLSENVLSDKNHAEQASADNSQLFYRKAIDSLLTISAIQSLEHYCLPVYDRDFIATELAIFPEWLLSKHLNLQLSVSEQQQLTQCFELLIANALAQPQCFMHRDFHSRNLMLTDSDKIAVIDFQDAVIGPITYDIVSLLRDCYIKWPPTLVDELFSYFQQQIESRLKQKISPEQWQRWFDLMGMQRHIKASGIFARLYHRDNKSGYLQDIPLTLTYLVDMGEKYPELGFIAQLVTEKVLPALALIESKS
ncbi:MAG: aminoglycoside phosphotransferase family protein [Thalassotalea sp.]